MTDVAWKPNWTETKQHFVDWWSGEGLVLGAQRAPSGGDPHEAVEDPGPAPSNELKYTDVVRRARRAHWALAHGSYCGDILPIADTWMGSGSLATFLGSEPEFADDTVWFRPCLHELPDPEGYPPLHFDPENRWWKVAEATAKESAGLGRGKYLVGFPELAENIDVLVSLRGADLLMQDMVERPEWVCRKVEEINEAWFEAYGRLYEIVRLEDGSSAFGAHHLWGPGKTGKLMCDNSVLFSPAMFESFVVPALTAQCEWLDHSLYSIDGYQSLNKLDALLSIDALDAIAWMPDTQVPSAGHPRWYDLYHRILNAGKSVQAYGIEPRDVTPLLDAVGSKGVYVLTGFGSESEAEDLYLRVEAYR